MEKNNTLREAASPLDTKITCLGSVDNDPTCN